jgi:NAD+ diphosphatase
MNDIKFCPVCTQELIWQTDEQEAGRLRKRCPDGHWTHWDNPVPVLAALVEFEGKIMLARNAAWPEKMFALITGFMERGETSEHGIARELKEETNLDADRVTLIGVYEFIKKNELIVAYHVLASGEIKLSEELIEFRMVEPKKLRPWRAGTGMAVADWMRLKGIEPHFLE